MKKLYLTSFTFTTGTEEVYKEDRIVMVTSKEVELFKTNTKDQPKFWDSLDELWMHAAQENAITWFKINFTESRLISVKSHPTITGIDNTSPVFQLAFGINEFPPRESSNPDISIDVLIDIDGYRKNFRVGYYNFPYDGLGGEWILYTSDDVTKHMKWMDILPLASKDK